MSAGTVNPNAASYTPFIFRMQRGDDDQELSQITTQLPPGLTARIAGKTICSDEAIEAAADPRRTGTEEKEHPSCPASSQVGTTEVGSGVGVPLTYIGGRIYLAGPYKGAPLSIVVISPILPGPYDLGNIVVRSAVHVDRATTAVTVVTDPFPQIYQGIPVRIRDIRLKIDSQETILNPTNCDPKTIGAHLTGAGGDVNTTADDTASDLSESFQVANCLALPFRPRLSFRLQGGTSRGDHPALSTTLVNKSGDANLRKVQVTLPRFTFIDQGHIRTICTRVQYAADECPQGSIYGYAKAWTPLLDQPVEGPVILRSSEPPTARPRDGPQRAGRRQRGRSDRLNQRAHSNDVRRHPGPAGEQIPTDAPGRRQRPARQRQRSLRVHAAGNRPHGRPERPDRRPVPADEEQLRESITEETQGINAVDIGTSTGRVGRADRCEITHRPAFRG